MNDHWLDPNARRFAEAFGLPEFEPVEEIQEEGFVDTLKALLRSRKVLLAVFGVVQTIVAHYFELPAEVWGAIDTLVLALIAAIAYEDAAEKRAS
jgi:hypothetical protein